MIDASIEDEEEIAQQMDDLAGQGKLSELVDGYSESDEPLVARALARTLALATSYMRGPDLAPLVLDAMRRFKSNDEKARAQLLAAMHQLAVRGELFGSRYPREAAVSVFLEDALGRGKEVQQVATAVVGWFYREGILEKFPPERRAALQKKLAPLLKSQIPEIRLEVEAMKEFLPAG
jgi:hypothetical protein